ncbi:MAG: aspartate carbamoyltransferase catalytic subunit [Myxococcota bacterium]|nr:aspartate carbamoyltransferase catalytic subunit [Myxococcota bacterium]
MKPVAGLGQLKSLDDLTNRSGWPHSLFSTDGLPRAAALDIIDTAREMVGVGRRRVKKLPTLRGRTVINAFFENSTRTRVSFELAGKRMGADVINFSASASSGAKGETLGDTARTLAAMNPDLIVIRHPDGGAPWFLRERVGCAVINAGDGINEHPTQALLDALTLMEQLGDLEGRTVAIVGDVAHSRVARSNIHLLHTLGANVFCVSPSTMRPAQMDLALKAQWTDDLDALLPRCDAVMMLRIQRERLRESLFPHNREFAIRFGLNPRRADLLPSHGIILHPGPMNRGVEIEPAVADGDRAMILSQVENGVAVRMALQLMLLGRSES